MLTIQEKYILDFKNCEMNPPPSWITPQVASDFLSRNKENYRSKNQTAIKKMERDILNGEWKINGSTISFTTDGCLVDGQHRLFAILKSNISVGALVVEGLNPDSVITMDNGITRKLSDHLSHNGEVNVKLLSTVIKNLGKYVQGNFFNKTESISYSAAMEILNRYPEIRDCVTKFSRKNLITTPSVLAVCYFILKLKHKNNVEMVDDFFDKIIFGNNLSDGEPLLILRNLFISSKIKGGTGLDRKFIASAIVKTWNYYLDPNPKKKRFTKNILLKDNSIPKPL